MPFHLDVSDPGQPQTVLPNRPGGIPGQAVVAMPRAKARVARLSSILDAAEKGLERPLQAAQRIAHGRAAHLRRPVARLAHLGQVTALPDVPDPLAAAPSIAALLEGSIVEVAGEAELGFERGSLLFRRIDPIPVGSKPLPTDHRGHLPRSLRQLSVVVPRKLLPYNAPRCSAT